MFSIGTISQFTRGASVVTMVSILQEGIVYVLSNPEKIPCPWPNLGLFQYEPQDQFCKWVDMKDIQLKS
jgi:hypothetical protein